MLFGSTNKHLEKINDILKLNASNNYRDSTLENLKELEDKFNELNLKKKLSSKQVKHYTELISNYKNEFKDFTHKAQNKKAGW